jgi:SAM-dependent methyltransferase
MFSFGKRAIRNSLSTILPNDLSAEVMYEAVASAKHFRSWMFERSKFRGARNVKLNIGCGANVAGGWINIDLEGPPGVFRWDCRRGMPFDDGSVDAIFAEHVFEHFGAATGSKFLMECHRCLRIGGGVRIVVPDAGKYLRLYPGEWNDLIPMRPLIEENGKFRDSWLECVYRTKMEFINEVFRQGTQHKYAYDADTLMMKMRDTGFAQVIHQSYGVTATSEKALDSQSRSTESLYVEGIK